MNLLSRCVPEVHLRLMWMTTILDLFWSGAILFRLQWEVRRPATLLCMQIMYTNIPSFGCFARSQSSANSSWTALQSLIRQSKVYCASTLRSRLKHTRPVWLDACCIADNILITVIQTATVFSLQKRGNHFILLINWPITIRHCCYLLVLGTFYLKKKTNKK